MKVGDVVVEKHHSEYGFGKIISFQVKMGTVLVKFENFKTCTYHTSWTLQKA
jgi:hypothetical protein|tara:strand:- start:3482 stop:3637 length:156 start_codon:yes stop_codon:yes gene_type:complete